MWNGGHFIFLIWLDSLKGFWSCWEIFIKYFFQWINSFMSFLASKGCFWPLTASMTSEVKNNYAYVITQDIFNNFIEVNFCVECMVSQPNRLLQRSTTTQFAKSCKTPFSHSISFHSLVIPTWIMKRIEMELTWLVWLLPIPTIWQNWIESFLKEQFSWWRLFPQQKRFPWF